MKNTTFNISRVLTGLVAVSLLIVGSVSLTSANPGASAGAKNRYLGAEACESCHSLEGAGNQYHVWEEAKHSQAFELLKSDRAIEVGKEKGVAEPWKSDECLKCHVTGFGEDKKQFKKSFDIELGVQCETCHGPAELHKKARFKAAASEEDEEEGFGDEEETVAEFVVLPEGELTITPDRDLCLKCHNTDSPTYKHFCFYQRVEKIRHIDPRKPRTDAEKDELLVCKFGEDCKCTPENCDDECPVAPSKLKDK